MSRPLVYLICVLGLLGPTGTWAATPFSLLAVDDGHVCNDSQYGPSAVYNTSTIHIRNTADPRRRVGFLKFDISSIRGGGVVSNVSISVYGYGAGDMDVYGIVESQDHTVADFQTLTWNTAPGVKNNPAPPLSAPVELDTADIVGPLLSFRAPASGVRASSPTSQALADFVNADTDGIIVLLLSAPVGQGPIIREVDWNSGEGGAKLEGEVGAAPVQARDPNPADKATDVWRDVVLSWTPGASISAHNLYFGSSLENVTAAGAGGPANVLSSLNQDANSYDPPGHLEFGQTYYWRVDEVNGVPDLTVFKGAVWSFTVEPLARAVTNVTATASSSDVAGGPQSTIDGSGLDGNGLLHSTVDKTMWLSAKSGPQPTWIQYQFDRVYKLHEMWVWNYNMSVESILGVGFKTVTVEYSANGTDWTALGDLEFAQGASAEGYAHNTTVDFRGVAAKYVKLIPKSNWGGITAQYGLSEVKFFYIPAHATEPKPSPGATSVNPGVVLSWRGGREAASHEVYFSADKQAVANGTALVGTADQAGYDPAPLNLELGKTYYWKIVEVNQAATPSAWESDIWSFSTREYFTIDDFEGYTNESPNRVFQTWIDGYGFSEDVFFPGGHLGNHTGSMIGYNPELGPIMETTIIHGGKQSMPVEYNNVNQPYYSEIERAWQTPQDWTLNGADTLQVGFRGNPIRFVQSLPSGITMSAAGTDIYGTADQFTFACKSLSGDGSIVVRVDSLENTDPWAKAGVMIRENLNPDSRFAAIYATPGNGVRYQARLLNAGDVTSDTSVATTEQKALVTPVWVKVERVGTTTFNGYYSTDGVKWTTMSWNPQTINVTGTAYIGLCVTSHNANVATTAVFSNASTSGAEGSWQFAEIGTDHKLNDRGTLYVVLKDSDGRTAIVTNPDADAVLRNTWQAWNIPLADFRSGGVNVAAIKTMCIGVGNRNNPVAGGTGTLFIDDIGFGRSAAVAP